MIVVLLVQRVRCEMSHIDGTAVTPWMAGEDVLDEIAFKPALKRAEQKVDPASYRDEQDNLGKGHALRLDSAQAGLRCLFTTEQVLERPWSFTRICRVVPNAGDQGYVGRV